MTSDDELTVRLETANELIRKYSTISMGAGLIPVPFVDMVALTGIQLKMLHHLAELYDISFSKELAKSLVASLLGGVISTQTAMETVMSLSKLIPVGGLVTGMVTMSLFGGAATYAVGKVFIQHFESGGTFLDLDPTKVREYFAAEFEKGKEQLKSQPAEQQKA